MIGEYTTAQGPEAKLTLKSVGVFTAVYLFAAIVFAVIQNVFEFDMKSADGIATMFVAGMITGQFFVKKVKRLPEKEEVTKIKIICTGVAIFLQLALAYIVAAVLANTGDNSLVAAIGSLPLLVVVFALCVVTFLQYLIMGRAFKNGVDNAYKELPTVEKSETV